MKNRLNILFNNILLLICVIGYLFPDFSANNALVSIGLIYVSINLIYRAYKAYNIPFLIIFLLFSTYCFAPIGYLLGFNEHIINNITEAENQSTVFLTSICLLLFMTSIHRYINLSIIRNLYNKKIKIKDINNNNDNLINYKSKYGFILTTVISICCTIFGITGSNLFEVGGYSDDIGSRSSLYEYGVIFLSLSLIYANSKQCRRIVYLICFIYIFRDLLYGGRVASFMLLLSIYTIRFINRFSFKQIIVFLVIGYLFFQFWGMYRSALDKVDFDILKKDGNSAFVLYASMRIHYLMDIGVLNVKLRFISLLGFIASIFVPSSFLPPVASLPSYLKDTYYTGGGGLVSTYIYCWLWIPGVYFIAKFVASSFNQLFNYNSPYKQFYALLLLITSPRWFAYYPIQIFKYAVFGVLAFWLINNILKIKSTKTIFHP